MTRDDFIPFPWPELLPIDDPERLEALARYAGVPLDYLWQPDPPGWRAPAVNRAP